MFRSRTLVSKSPSDIVQSLHGLVDPKSTTLLYSVSTNTPEDSLRTILAGLRRSAKQSIGCLSAPHPAYPADHIACSTLYLNSNQWVPFRSTIPGRAPIHVGRRDTRRTTHFKDNSDGSLMGSPWEGSFSRSESQNGSALPAELDNNKPNDITSLLFFSDGSPDGLVRSLDQLPASKMGLIASSTPFINGRPFTLFYNDEIHSSGAVGIAALRTRSPTFREPSVYFADLVPLSSGLGVVTQSEGNLIHQIDGMNAAQVLIDATAKAGRGLAKKDDNKDDNIFIRLMGPWGPLQQLQQETSQASGTGVRAVHSGVGELGRVYRVISGGPSRGIIALDTDESIRTGTYVTAYTQEGYDTSVISPLDGTAIYFMNSADGGYRPPTAGQQANEERCFKVEPFQVRSENGFLHNTFSSGLPTYKCNIPGAQMFWHI